LTPSFALDVVCFGEALVDFFPDRPGVPLAEVETFHRHLGGAPANVAVGLARLGLTSGLVTLVGADEFGRFVRSQLSADRVDVLGVGMHRTARTGVTFVAVGPSGERSFTFYRNPSADMMIEAVDIGGGVARRGRVFHFGSSTLAREPARSATLSALADAREAGSLVSCDPNWRPHLWSEPAEAPALIRQTLAECDVVKLSDDEIVPLFGASSPERAAAELRELGVTLAIISLGARGCYFQSPSGSGYAPGEKVQAVDTTGAGDGFMAGLWAGLLPTLAERSLAHLDTPTLTKTLALANRVGAFACTRFGASTALPYRTEVDWP
jgi:fructokinase